MTYPQGHQFQPLKFNFLLKIICKNFILQVIFQSAQHIYEKREGSGSIPLTNGSGSGSGSPTLLITSCFTVQSGF